MSESVRFTPDPRQADDWALALASAGIGAVIDQVPGGWALRVADDDRATADAVLDSYERENRRPPSPPPPREYGHTYAPAVVTLVLAALFALTGERTASSPWFERGSAAAERIAAGEPWRAVTALTLHADAFHILTNIAALLVFGTGLCAAVGPGVGLWLMLLAGAGGNLLTAWLRGAPYRSVGASTAVFGAVGALAALQLYRRRTRSGATTWRRWAPLAAGLALLAFLGTAPGTDSVAHLFGFVAGLAFGGLAALAWPEPARAPVQRVLLVAAALLVLSCWLLALRG